jgi:oxygen-independent coproporphyrinogen-3 oxidase
VPFCAHHCGYCDFAVAAGKDELIELYLDALGAELSQLERPHPVETLFLGGGTPTHLRPEQLRRLLSTIGEWLPCLPGYEFSVEANPGTLTSEKVAVLAEFAISRVSLGAQSFNRHLLKTLERDHFPTDIVRAVQLVKQQIAQVSLDLIFGVPGQELADWRADLSQALALCPEHLSTYGLTYEKGTPFWKRRERGDFQSLGEEDELAMYALAIDILEEAGYEQYEISNFARPGKRCRHNQIYWANEPYLGFGMGAARYVDGRREVNTRSLQKYIKRALAGEPVTFQSEMLEGEDRARETLAIQLRRAEGVNRVGFREQTGIELDDLAGAVLRSHTAQGFLCDDGENVRLTRRGKYVADAVILDLFRR